MSTLEEFTENLPSSIGGLAKEVIKAGWNVGCLVGKRISLLIDALFNDN